MSASSSRVARWAHGVVVDWTLHVVRGLPRRIADDRFDEIRSDLWEHAHAADARGRSGARLAAELLLRLVAGIPADLAWRRGVLTRSTAASPIARAPLPLATRPFDQTNGAVDLTSTAEREPDDEVRDLLLKGATSNFAFGFFGGGTGI